MKFCINHPENPVITGRKICIICQKREAKAANQNYREKIRAKGIPPKEEIQKLIDLNYPVFSIAIRYQTEETTVKSWIKKYGCVKKTREAGGIPINTKTYNYF